MCGKKGGQTSGQKWMENITKGYKNYLTWWEDHALNIMPWNTACFVTSSSMCPQFAEFVYCFLWRVCLLFDQHTVDGMSHKLPDRYHSFTRKVFCQDLWNSWYHGFDVFFSIASTKCTVLTGPDKPSVSFWSYLNQGACS